MASLSVGLPELLLFLGGSVLCAAASGSVIFAVLWWNRTHANLRRSRLEQLARRLGFEFVAASPAKLRDLSELGSPDAALLNRLGLHDPVCLPFRDRLEGRRGEASFQIADVTDPGDDVLTRSTLVSVEHPRLRPPTFGVRPRSALGLERIGLAPIPFPEDPDFEAAVVVVGPEPDQVTAFLNGHRRQALLAVGPRLFWQCHAGTLAVTDGGLADAAEGEALVALLERVLPVLLD